MSLAILHSRASVGVNAPVVTVEVHLSNGLPGLSIVGLPEAAVRESRYRVRSAIINSQLTFPVKRITVNLAPADLPKEGGRFDLAIALGILAASDQIPKDNLSNYEFIAELALSGELRFIRGILPIILAATQAERKVIISAVNAEEAALSSKGVIFIASDLLAVCAHLRSEKSLTLLARSSPVCLPHYSDLNEVHGQIIGKRALEIAAAGRHSLLFSGPPGTGKTMLATRLPGILPPMNREEAVEVAAIYSLYKEGRSHLVHWRERPFRAPHHSISGVAMVGGSYPPHPGEVSLAHHGVLFLDEFLEFTRPVLESLREPLETSVITIARASYHIEFPAHFQLVAAMNPCPCGYFGDIRGRCRCSSEQVRRYQARLSGPLMDRLDLYVPLLPIPAAHLLQNIPEGESSRCVRQRVKKARQCQHKRAKKVNAQFNVEDIRTHCLLSSNDEKLITEAIEHFSLSARSYHRVLKVARTIADLSECKRIQRHHLTEAMSYRPMLPE